MLILSKSLLRFILKCGALALLASLLALPCVNIGGINNTAWAAEESAASDNRLDLLEQHVNNQELLNIRRLESVEVQMESVDNNVNRVLLIFGLLLVLALAILINYQRAVTRLSEERIQKASEKAEALMRDIQRELTRPETEFLRIGYFLRRLMREFLERQVTSADIAKARVYGQDPNLPISLHCIARSLVAGFEERWKDAIELLEQMRQMDREDPFVLLHLSNAHAHFSRLSAVKKEQQHHSKLSSQYYAQYVMLAAATPGTPQTHGNPAEWRLDGVRADTPKVAVQPRQNLEAPPVTKPAVLEAPAVVATPPPILDRTPAVLAPPAPVAAKPAFLDKPVLKPQPPARVPSMSTPAARHVPSPTIMVPPTEDKAIAAAPSATLIQKPADIKPVVTELPVAESVTESPVVESIVTESVETESVVAELSVTESVTELPVVESIVTESAETKPVVTELPVTESVTELPVVESIVTESAETKSVVAELSVTESVTESPVAESVVAESSDIIAAEILEQKPAEEIADTVNPIIESDSLADEKKHAELSSEIADEKSSLSFKAAEAAEIKAAQIKAEEAAELAEAAEAAEAKKLAEAVEAAELAEAELQTQSQPAAAAQPVTESIAPPSVVVQEVAQEVAESIAQPVAESVAEFVTESPAVAQPVVQEVAESISQPIAESIIQPSAVAQPIAQPVVEVQQAAQLAAPVIAQPVTQAVEQSAIVQTQNVQTQVTQVTKTLPPLISSVTDVPQTLRVNGAANHANNNANNGGSFLRKIGGAVFRGADAVVSTPMGILKSFSVNKNGNATLPFLSVPELSLVPDSKNAAELKMWQQIRKGDTRILEASSEFSMRRRNKLIDAALLCYTEAQGHKTNQTLYLNWGLALQGKAMHLPLQKRDLYFNAAVDKFLAGNVIAPHQFDFAIASLYAVIGNMEECHQWLQKSSESGQLDTTMLRIAPEFDSVRRQPWFTDFVRDAA